MTDDRFALIVATYEYQDPTFSKLCAPAQDAEDMARVLADPEIGDFQVTTLLNELSSHVREGIEQFFLDRRREDTLLLYLSGHGIKDEYGKLFFATANTKRKLLHSTAVPAQFVNDMMNKSRSRQMVILLDCCYAGAFAKGMVIKGSQEIGAAEFLKGQGRIVITASDAMEYAFEGDTVQAPAGEPVRSIFTSSVVQGLETGEADKNGDGIITADDLYDYVHDRVTSQTTHQRPKRWAFNVHGDIRIACSRMIKPVPLPPALQDLLHNEIPSARLKGVNILEKILQGSNKGQKISALQALQEMREDDSQKVRTAVSQVLAAPEVVEMGSPVSSRELLVNQPPLETPMRADEKLPKAQEIPETFTEPFSTMSGERTTSSLEPAPVTDTGETPTGEQPAHVIPGRTRTMRPWQVGAMLGGIAGFFLGVFITIILVALTGRYLSAPVFLGIFIPVGAILGALIASGMTTGEQDA